MSPDKIHLARLIYEAYPDADLLPLDPVRDCLSLAVLAAKVQRSHIGDGLFTLLVIEIQEGGEGTLDGAIRVMQQIKKDVESVLQVLCAESNK